MYCGEIVSRYSTPAGKPERVDLAEQAAAEPQALVDVEAAVEVGVVDEPLPADRRARLLEIHAHDDLELARVRIAQRPQPLRVLERRLRIVDRARPDHDDEPIVLAVQDAVQRAARVRDVVGHRLRARQLEQELGRRRERRETADA